MEAITLSDISTALTFIIALGGSVAAIIAGVKKALKGLFKEQMDEISKRLDQQEKSIQKIDLENCRNFLVSYLAKVECGGAHDEIETQRFWEEYEHYTSQGGNSYIKEKVKKLQQQGKL